MSPVSTLLAAAATLALASCDNVGAPLPSLGGQTGHFRLAENAPESRFGPADANSTTGEAVAESSFGPAGAETSAFRLAEVAPDRLEETRILLSELAAKQDANQDIRFSLPTDILFDFDKAALRPDGQATLLKAKRLISAYPRVPVSIVGHTDAKGDDVYNDRLSLARAQAVSASLAEGGNRQLTVKGIGEREPVAPNAHADGSDDADGRQRNRRVEIIISPRPKE
jgi:outer membrane protein OmpA-like peptidoglycan-associated protein